MRRRVTVWPLLLAVGWLVLCLPVRSAAQSRLCESSPRVREAFRNLPKSTGDAVSDRARAAALEALLERFPNDVFAHHRYQDTARYPTEKERDEVIAKYQALLQKHPNDPLYIYLAARAAVGATTKQVLPDLERVASVMPPARLTLVQIYQSPAFKDVSKANEQLEAYARACPTSIAAVSYYREVEPSEFLTKSTTRFRTLLEARKDVDFLAYYSTLWALEFRVKPAGEHEALRRQVAQDVRRLRTVPPARRNEFLYVMEEGYKLTSDTEGAAWVADQMRKSPTSGYSAARSEWSAKNPYPKPGESEEKQKAYRAALVQATGEWVRQWPNEVSAWFARVGALQEADGVPTSEIETAGEQLLKAVERNPRAMSFGSQIGGNSFALQVAHLYAQHGVRADRLPDLVAKGLAEITSPVRLGYGSDLYPRPSNTGTSDFTKYYGQRTIVDVWLKVADKARARRALLDLQTMADASKPKPDAKDPQQDAKAATYRSRQVDYWHRMGDLAQLEGKKTDAMTYYQNALLARASASSQGAKDELAERARALWTGLGGSNEAWQAWFTRADLFGLAKAASVAVAFTKMEKALPEFDLADLSGAQWRLADFKGKATLVGIWATW